MRFGGVAADPAAPDAPPEAAYHQYASEGSSNGETAGTAQSSASAPPRDAGVSQGDKASCSAYNADTTGVTDPSSRPSKSCPLVPPCSPNSTTNTSRKPVEALLSVDNDGAHKKKSIGKKRPVIILRLRPRSREGVSNGTDLDTDKIASSVALPQAQPKTTQQPQQEQLQQQLQTVKRKNFRAASDKADLPHATLHSYFKRPPATASKAEHVAPHTDEARLNQSVDVADADMSDNGDNGDDAIQSSVTCDDTNEDMSSARKTSRLLRKRRSSATQQENLSLNNDADLEKIAPIFLNQKASERKRHYVARSKQVEESKRLRLESEHRTKELAKVWGASNVNPFFTRKYPGAPMDTKHPGSATSDTTTLLPISAANIPLMEASQPSSWNCHVSGNFSDVHSTVSTFPPTPMFPRRQLQRSLSRYVASDMTFSELYASWAKGAAFPRVSSPQKAVVHPSSNTPSCNLSKPDTLQLSQLFNMKDKQNLSSSVIRLSWSDIAAYITSLATKCPQVEHLLAHVPHRASSSPLNTSMSTKEVPASSPSLLWADKYAPQRTEEVLANESCAATIKSCLRDWLVSWGEPTIPSGEKNREAGPSIAFPRKRATKSKGKKQKRKMRLHYDPDVHDIDDMDDFIVPDSPDNAACHDGSDNESSYDGSVHVRQKHLLLYGPVASLKTATVYAVARELGYEVFEIHSGNKRSGKDITATVGEMIVSHQVGAGNTVRPSTHEAKTNHKGSSVSNMSATSSKQPERARKGINGDGAPVPPSASPRQSLILLEDVDILFEQDKGFWSSVVSLMERSKRPIIMTCNDIVFHQSNTTIHPALMDGDLRDRLSILTFSRPTTEQISLHLHAILIVEGFLVDPKSLAKLAELYDRDLKKCLHSLQLWLQGRRIQQNAINLTSTTVSHVGQSADTATPQVARQELESNILIRVVDINLNELAGFAIEPSSDRRNYVDTVCEFTCSFGDETSWETSGADGLWGMVAATIHPSLGNWRTENFFKVDDGNDKEDETTTSNEGERDGDKLGLRQKNVRAIQILAEYTDALSSVDANLGKWALHPFDLNMRVKPTSRVSMDDAALASHAIGLPNSSSMSASPVLDVVTTYPILCNETQQPSSLGAMMEEYVGSLPCELAALLHEEARLVASLALFPINPHVLTRSTNEHFFYIMNELVAGMGRDRDVSVASSSDANYETLASVFSAHTFFTDSPFVPLNLVYLNRKALALEYRPAVERIAVADAEALARPSSRNSQGMNAGKRITRARQAASKRRYLDELNNDDLKLIMIPWQNQQ